MSTLPEHLAAPLERFLATVRAKRDPPPTDEPDAMAEMPSDDLIRMALILEPFARHVVHYRDRKEGDLYVARKSLWGNPHRLADPDDETERLTVIRAYAVDFARRSGKQQLYMLATIRKTIARGNCLVCYCAPKPCHAQVLAAWAMNRRITLEDLGETP